MQIKNSNKANKFESLMKTLASVQVLAIMAVSAFGYSLLSMSVYAQNIEEVVIEADFVEDQTMDDLVSITALDAEKLADAGIENIEDAAAYVPNLNLTNAGSETSLCVRGLCPGFNRGFDASVGIYNDGVPYTRSQMARAPFLDLSSFQVLRGPQYVKDGNYSIAGSIHLISDLAADEFKSSVDFNYIPEQNSKKLLMTLGGPLNDSMSAKVVLQSKNSDGFMLNQYTGERNTQEDELLGRLVFGFQPTDNLSFRFKVEHGTFDTKGSDRELILDNPTEPILLANGNKRKTAASARSRLAIRGIATDFLTEADYINRPRNNFFDAITVRENWATLAPLNAADFQVGDFRGVTFDTLGNLVGSPAVGPIDFAFAGRSYLDVLAEIYERGQIECASGIATISVAGDPDPQALPCDPADFALPSGLLDKKLDYRRSADGAEFSANTSQNFTLNTEYYWGETRLQFTASYIEYLYEETLDGDGLAVPLITVEQSEDFDQSFYRLDFETPEGEFMELEGGISYLDSSVVYEQTNAILARFRERDLRADLARPSGEKVTSVGVDGKPDIAWGYYSRVDGLNSGVRGNTRYAPYRLYELDTEITAIFLSTKLNWTDTFYTEIGARYTHAEKDAIRDLGIINLDGSEFDAEQIYEDFVVNGNTPSDFLSFLSSRSNSQGLQIHSDQFAALSQEELRLLVPGIGTPQYAQKGTRVEEKLYPSFRFNWQVNDVLSLKGAVAFAGKVGGFDALSNQTPQGGIGSGSSPPGTFGFEDEKATTYELGGSLEFLDGLGSISLTAFYTQYRDLQINRTDGFGGANVDNAGAATSQGIEVDGNLQLTDNFSVNYAFAYIDFTYDDFRNGACYFGQLPELYFFAREPGVGVSYYTYDGDPVTTGDYVPIRYDFYRRGGFGGDNQRAFDEYDFVSASASSPTDYLSLDLLGDESNVVGVDAFDYRIGSVTFCDHTGKTPALLADFQGSVSFNYEREVVNLGLFKPTLDVLYNSGYDTISSLDPAVRQDAYFQFNGRLELASFDDIWAVAITGQNLTNEEIVAFSFETPFATGLQGAQSYSAILRPPRTIGINLQYKFY